MFDDTPDGSVKEAVDALNDDRVRYTRNRQRRFSSMNINSCFASSGLPGSEVFSVLEDDNYLMPHFMAENLRLLSTAGAKVVLRNQYIESSELNEADGQIQERTTLEKRYSEGIYTAEQFHATLLLGRGWLSNGALVWSKNAQSSFELRECTEDPLIDEYLRTLLLEEDIYVALTPLAAWRANGAETTRWKSAKLPPWERFFHVRRAAEFAILERQLSRQRLRQDNPAKSISWLSLLARNTGSSSYLTELVLLFQQYRNNPDSLEKCFLEMEILAPGIRNFVIKQMKIYT